MPSRRSSPSKKAAKTPQKGMEINCIYKDKRWSAAKVWVRKFCKLTFEEVKIAKHSDRVELAVVFADDLFIQELNHTYRHNDKPTNVLSFPIYPELLRMIDTIPSGEPLELGDVILSYDTIAREAETQHKDFQHHAAHLMVHGLLHLLGFDHEEASDAEMMEAHEIAILKKAGLNNPYQH